ncbi:phosphotriesterase family protein [Bifidobacterium actinocoloniiforme DSM 22766]|uniref:Phosphotriesterase family protein n=1 Tax=Bifidobacterium actinocoloniiforme DSM 22766 TaxID=1437605 RepID=A0A086Z2B2_9BIFI|nr:phosphotriesterase [Bifidobacterium actinocoloniiforme]AKV55677.1 phosphotriesterase [Bifidobacterium actinocoloniiforme DSM 22766]KFI40662.1 phosphotriesterase family protein [Bifidobacterium actinocoloniiforme DSM 22766]
MAIARTILGDVDPSTLGVVDSHDHLIRVGAGEVYIDGDHQLDSVEKAETEAGYFAQASLNWSKNGGTVVDMCPINCGRDPRKLSEVARSVDHLQVIAATGFHREHVYLETQSHWINRYTPDQIAELVIADIREGIDQNDYSGPIVERSPYKAGVIKVGTAYGEITPFEHKCMEAAAMASIETGAPINTHTTYGTCGLEQAQTLIDMGVPADQIAIGHIQRNADVYYLEQILDLGVYLEIDGTNRIKYQPDSNRFMELAAFKKDGFEDRILLGTDSGKRSYQKVYGSVSGVDYNPAVDGPRMIAEGFDPAYVDKLLMTNAQRFFTLRKEA